MASQPSFRAVPHVRRPRLSDTITDQIEDLIASGKLRPGDRLPAERELAQQLDVSRPSLREALLILESRGLLQARRGGGFNVTDVTAPTITDPLVHLLQRHPETVDDGGAGRALAGREPEQRHLMRARGQRSGEVPDVPLLAAGNRRKELGQ